MAHEASRLETLDENDHFELSTIRSTPSPELFKTPTFGAFQLSDDQPLEISDGSKDPADLQKDVSPSDSVNPLGILGSRKSSAASMRRKPVAAMTTPPLAANLSTPSTPKPSHNLLGSPSSSHVQSPRYPSFLWASQLAHRLRLSRGNNSEDQSISQETARLVTDHFDDEILNEKFGQPPTFCSSKKDITTPRNHYTPSWILLISIYSTALSFLWVALSICQPGLRRFISASRGPSERFLSPGTATSITALLAKSIEISFGTVFVAFLGQVLSKRCLVPKKGLTLAEMDLRNWVTQPGCLVSHFEALRYNMRGLLGCMTLLATLSAMFYTTASDALVAPKLRYGQPQELHLVGPVRSSYANVAFVKTLCPDLFSDVTADKVHDKAEDGSACLNVQLSGQSYRDLLAFISMWSQLRGNGTLGTSDMAHRPRGTNLLYHNISMTSSWTETWNSNVTAKYQKYNRIVNNVTMAIPHPGIFSAATSPKNSIQQPDELSNRGGYNIRASVVSPAVNVMCVELTGKELDPLIYASWPNSNESITDNSWRDQISPTIADTGEMDYLNETVVDDIFKWGPEYKRRRPVFRKLPPPFNFVSNTTVSPSDAVYLLGRSGGQNFTLCEARSWLSLDCSTRFNVSGSGSIEYDSHCDDPSDTHAYHRVLDDDNLMPATAPDWKVSFERRPTVSLLPGAFSFLRSSTKFILQWLANEWATTNNMNGGAHGAGDNSANHRILTQLALSEPELPPNMPSIAEAFAVFMGATLVMGSVQTPFNHTWDHPTISSLKEVLDAPFKATLIAQEYTSCHNLPWQAVFYIPFVSTAILNSICFLYFISQREVVTDITLPENHFSLTMNSPPSAQLAGSCGGGPKKRDLVIPWRLAYAWKSKHYFFLEASERPRKGKYKHEDRMMASHQESVEDLRGRSYQRLSSRSRWWS